MKQIPLPIVLPPAEGFETVQVGPNAEAVAHLRGLNPVAAAQPPVYLWGASGTGKTRLLRALVAANGLAGGSAGWFDAATALPWEADPQWRLVVLDDADQLDAERQQAAFALFVEADSHGQQWAAAGRLPPVDLPLRDDLRSRLGWGHVFALQPLGDAQAGLALRREAARRGIVLSDEVVDFLLTRFSRDMCHLMHLLQRLDDFALAEQRVITVPLLKKMLAEETTP